MLLGRGTVLKKLATGIALVAAADANTGTANSSTMDTYAMDSTGADFIAVYVSCNEGVGGSLPTLSDSYGNTWTYAAARPGGASWNGAFYYCFSPSVGTGHTFTVTNSGGSFSGICAAAFSGGITAFDQRASPGPPSSAPGTITAAGSPALYLAGITANEDPTGFTINDGFTRAAKSVSVGFHIGGDLAYRIDSTAAAAAPTFSGATDGNRNAVLFSFI